MFALRILHRGLLASALFTLTAFATIRADGAKDNVPETVRPIPPKGVAVSPADREAFEDGLQALRLGLEAFTARNKNPQLAELLPDVEIYSKAVSDALRYDEFFTAKDITSAKALMITGNKRLAELRTGEPSWPTATGLVVRGYRSKIDGSVQPYGLVVPASFGTDAKKPRRLDFWWHGRGETLSEVNFITGRQASVGEFAPEDAFVLHPYGRYSNANKFAGEVDTFECLEHAKKHYPIDENRLVARGFSMGGAACWQFATHFPTLWCAANPGAGFAETPEFLNVFQNEKVEPTWYEKKLWHLYNATDYAQNIFNLPTVAYSGEIDRQKQAADVMARDMKKVGLELTHIIGPKTGHKYEPEAKKEVAKRIDAIAAKGKDQAPKEIKFVTYTTRYSRSGWIEVTGLEKHWELASVNAKIEADGTPSITTKNVSRLTLWGAPEFIMKNPPRHVVIDGTKLEIPLGTDSQVYALYRKVNGKWEPAPRKSDELVKKPGLQGPIDDALMDRFVMVSPSGKSSNEKVESFVQGEMKHAVEHWRKHFRGDAIVKADKDITDADIANSNLILWGDPSSNAVLAKIAGKLPIQWGKDSVTIGGKTYPAGTHVPVMIYPNPLNPKKYVVLNSGFTFREYAYLNNARQVPMLPDYAIVDVTTPPNFRYPGKIVQAGFFGEKWELLPDDGQ